VKISFLKEERSKILIHFRMAHLLNFLLKKQGLLKYYLLQKEQVWKFHLYLKS